MKKILIIALMALVTLLQADYVIKYNMDGEKMEFMYKNSTTSKMVTNSEDGKVEIYHIDKNSYLVTYTDDGVNVVDMNEMKAKAKAMGFDPSMYAQKQEKPVYKIKKTGKRVNVGGVKGEEWIVSGNENGQSYKSTMVVTNDPNVVKIMIAFFNSISSMSGGMVSSTNLFEVEKGYTMIKADGMKLESFKSKSLSPSEYKLPKVTNTREAFNERNKKNEPSKTITKKRVVAKDTLACYDNPCCGKIAGESTVLIPSLYKNKGGTGYFFVDSATCKKNALGQRTEVVIVEEQGTGRRVYLELILNDKNGIVQKLIDGQTDYGSSSSTLVSQASKDVSGNKAMYVHSRNTNQERMDIYLGNGATLCMAREYRDDWKRSFEGWAEKGWIFYKTLKTNVKNWNPSKAIPPKKTSNAAAGYKTSTKKVEPQEAKEDSGISGDDVDKAVNLLKSFF